MSKEPIRILAVNPGTRYVGFAALRGPELLDWGVKAIRAQGRRKKVGAMGAILLEAVERFHPDTVVIKRLHPSRTSPALDGLVDAIRQICKRRRLRVRQYSLSQVKDVLLPEAKGNKRRLAESVANAYAALVHDFQKETTNRNPYYVRMFEAVALGIVCYRTTGE